MGAPVAATMVQGVLDLSGTDPCPAPAARAGGPQPEGGGLAAALDALLSRVGVASCAEQDAVSEAVDAELGARGYTARIASLRHGTLRLRTCPQTARFLRYDLDAVLAGVQERVPGTVERIVVEVERRPVTP